MDAQSVIDNVSRTLIDEAASRRWTEAELLTYLNEAIRATITRKPSANVTNASVIMTSGSKQTVPSLCVVLQEVITNMGTDGLTPGRGVTLIDMAQLSRNYVSWRADTRTSTVKHWMYSPKVDPKTFYVYPPSDGTGYLELSYSTIPTEMTDIDETLPLDDMYLNALMEYMLFRCFEKDSDTPNNQIRATGHFQAFLQMLGAKLSTEAVQDPNIARDPNVKE